MCIACELGLLIAMDELPDAPPPGFPRASSQRPADFVCDAPVEAQSASEKSETKGEHKS